MCVLKLRSQLENTDEDESQSEFDDEKDDDDDATFVPEFDDNFDTDSSVVDTAGLSDGDTVVMNTAAAAGSAAAASLQHKRVRLKKNCHAKGVSLPRHLRMSHGWSHRKSVTAVGNFVLHKSYVYRSPKTQRKAVDSHRSRQCPLDGCYAVVKRLPPHLRIHHCIKDESVVRDLLRKARLSKSSLNERLNDTDSEEDSSADYLQDNDHDMAAEPASDYAAVSEHEMEPLQAYTEDSNDSTYFDSFALWLQTADGGRKSKKSAKQHTFQAQTVASVTGSESHPLDLFSKESLQAKFLGTFVKHKNFSPATTRCYLASLIHFGNYMMTQRYVSDESKSHIQTMLSCLRRWIASFRKECCERSKLKMDVDVQNLVTPADIQVLQTSVVSREAIKLLAAAQTEDAQAVSVKEYIVVRDYLLAQVVLANANRSGVLSSMLSSDIINARRPHGCLCIETQNCMDAWPGQDSADKGSVFVAKTVYEQHFAADMQSQWVALS